MEGPYLITGLIMLILFVYFVLALLPPVDSMWRVLVSPLGSGKMSE